MPSASRLEKLSSFACRTALPLVMSTFKHVFSMSCTKHVRGVKREVWSVKSAMRNMKCEVELQM